MSSIVQTIQKRPSLLPTKQPLPISSSNTSQQHPSALRRRLSSLSLKIQPFSASPAAAWATRRSKSVSAMGEKAGSSIKKWWDLGWSWILPRNPSFSLDLEMNEEEKHFLGFQNRGSLRHIFYKLKSELKKLLRYDDMTLPQTFRYDSSDYSKNFDDGLKRSAFG